MQPITTNRGAVRDIRSLLWGRDDNGKKVPIVLGIGGACRVLISKTDGTPLLDVAATIVQDDGERTIVRYLLDPVAQNLPVGHYRIHFRTIPGGDEPDIIPPGDEYVPLYVGPDPREAPEAP